MFNRIRWEHASQIFQCRHDSYAYHWFGWPTVRWFKLMPAHVHSVALVSKRTAMPTSMQVPRQVTEQQPPDEGVVLDEPCSLQVRQLPLSSYIILVFFISLVAACFLYSSLPPLRILCDMPSPNVQYSFLLISFTASYSVHFLVFLGALMLLLRCVSSSCCLRFNTHVPACVRAGPSRHGSGPCSSVAGAAGTAQRGRGIRRGGYDRR